MVISSTMSVGVMSVHRVTAATVWSPSNECDDGNDDNSDDCTENCRRPFCGDGLVHPTEAATTVISLIMMIARMSVPSRGVAI